MGRKWAFAAVFNLGIATAAWALSFDSFDLLLLLGSALVVTYTVSLILWRLLHKGLIRSDDWLFQLSLVLASYAFGLPVYLGLRMALHDGETWRALGFLWWSLGLPVAGLAAMMAIAASVLRAVKRHRGAS